MRRGFREIREIREDKGERTLPYQQIKPETDITVEDAMNYIRGLFADDYEDEEKRNEVIRKADEAAQRIVASVR